MRPQQAPAAGSVFEGHKQVIKQVITNPAVIKQLITNPAVIKQVITNPAVIKQLITNPAVIKQLITAQPRKRGSTRPAVPGAAASRMDHSAGRSTLHGKRLVGDLSEVPLPRRCQPA